MIQKVSTTKGRDLGLLELVAMGVGGMIGGGIFSVLGLAVGITGHAAPLAFALGSLIALAAGYSYIRLALTFRSDGASYTYLAHAFPGQPHIAGITGWTVILGYVGTLALYAFTFGAYGGDLLGQAGNPVMRMALSVAVLVFFLLVNLRGTKTSGRTEDVIVYAKIFLLGVFVVAGFSTIRSDYLMPVIDKGVPSVFMAGALIFVAFEGFQLITNAVRETRNPHRDIPRGIYLSIFITSIIYILLSIVGIGNLPIGELIKAEEYALAAAAKPVLGEAGAVLVAIAALMATSSAINATVFGASRMMASMGLDHVMPRIMSINSERNVPFVAVSVLTGAGIVFTVLGGLKVIAAFSSMTFLMVSILVSLANLRLLHKTRAKLWLIWLGLALMITTVLLLIIHLWQHEPKTLGSILGLYVAVVFAELLVNGRRSTS
jgi:amino acid transporter